MKKRSLRREIITIVAVLVAAAIFICVLLNFTVLESVYSNQKQKRMVEVYEMVETAFQEDTIDSTEFEAEFEGLTATGNMNVIVQKPDGEEVLSMVNDFDEMQSEFYDLLFSGAGGQNSRLFSGQILLKETDDYEIYRNHNDRLDEDYLTLIGTVSTGYYIMIRTPQESIREAANLSGRFLLGVGVLVVLFAIAVGFVLTRRIMMPLQMLTEISRQMADLDFDAKYRRGYWNSTEWRENHPRRAPRDIFARDKLAYVSETERESEGNEIDQLGSYMNRLSDELQATISELKSANAELEKDIEKKTQIDEMRTEFLSNVSHELKTPLALIQGYAEGLQACINDDAEDREFYCEVIIDEANKMNRMVQKLLTLNQLEFGNEQLTMERFDIVELLRGVANATQILREQKGITLQMDIIGPEYVWGDEFKVEEVVTNYMSNAINHCDGDKVIRVSLEKRSEETLRIRVFNTGQPIPEEDLDRIWGKFYKVDKARTREYGGSGIGLSIVKAIMDSFNQECGVTNYPHGVEFWFELSRK